MKLFSVAVLLTFLSSAGWSALPKIKNNSETGDIKIFLNHLAVNLDAESYAALTKAPFIVNEFSWFKIVTNSSGNATWTGAYLFGRETYLEFFAIRDIADPNYIQEQVNLGTEQIGSSAVLLSRVSEVNPEVPFTQQTMTDENGLPWIIWVSSSRFDKSTLNVEFMEYDQDYVKSRGCPDITRLCYNSKKFQPEKYLRDIDEITVRLTAADYNVFRSIAKGGRFSEAKKEGVLEFCATDLTIRVLDAAAAESRVLSLGLVLNYPKTEGPLEYNFGAVKLKFHSDARATMIFSE